MKMVRASAKKTRIMKCNEQLTTANVAFEVVDSVDIVEVDSSYAMYDWSDKGKRNHNLLQDRTTVHHRCRLSLHGPPGPKCKSCTWTLGICYLQRDSAFLILI